VNLRGAAYLTDENIHADVVAFLRSEGCDVLDVKESGLIGADDLPLIRRAHAEQRVVLTHDSDFGKLAVAAGEPIVGIVYLRPGHILSAFVIEMVRTLFGQALQLTPPFIVVARRSGSTIRIRVRNL
jgi:predicted nuclease of predicted toxin-antitoxin system